MSLISLNGNTQTEQDDKKNATTISLFYLTLFGQRCSRDTTCTLNDR